MVENNLGRNITFPIYYDTVVNGTATQHETGLVIHKATVETSVMSLGDKITGDVYYANNSLQVTMQEYIVYNNVRYILVNPPTIIREGMVVDNGDLRGMTKYSFEFYHPMYVLGNFPFSDVAVSQDEKRYLSENKSFSWIGKPQDFIDKINKNLEGTEWIVVKSENFPADTENELSDVLTFDNNTIADALKTGYETWGLPYIVDQIREDEDEQAYNNGKRFKVVFGLPSNVIKNGQDEYVFRMGQGVGLKNNSRTPRNNKIVTRIAGYGSENNIPYGYPQIQWYGENSAKFTYGDHAGVYDNVTIGGRTFAKFVSYPIYDGIVGGQNVKLIKHPFTRNHLMPSVYRRELFNKVSPYLSGGSINSYYNPDIELVDYYDANTDSYPNQINLSSPSYEIHQFEDIKPELGEAKIVGVQPINNDGTDADGWDDTIDDDGNYLQSYFKITLPQLDFDLYACAAITEEMQINMRGGACIGCTFPVQVDWDDYKKNFYDDQGNFAPNGAQRNLTKYPKSNSGRITLILQKDNNTFGTLMPNIYQQPKGETSFGEDDGDEFVILGISLPDTYVTNAEGRLETEMQAYMLANNIYYYDYPLKFDEYFLATHTNILSQIRTNTQVKFQFANEDPMTLFVKQIVIKYGDNVLPQYDITLTDSVEVVLNQIGQVADSVEKLSTLVSVLRQSYNRNVWGEIAKKLSKTSNDTAQGEITFVQGLKIGSNGNNGITPNGDATLNDVNVSGDLTITHVETPQGGEPIVKEYGITNDGDISGEGLTLGDYSEGLLGTGGVFKMINGKSYLEADRLYVRMKAYFDTLEIRRYIHSGGNRVASAAGMKCSRVEWYSNDTAQGTPLDQTNPDNKALVKRFKCYFNKTDGNRTITNDFVIADLAYCKTTNLAGSNQNAELNQKYYWRRVKGVGTTDKEHYIVLSNTDNEFDGTDFPEAEDDIVQLGNGNSNAHADRQGAIIEAVSQSGACAPTYRIYQGINSFNLENKCKVDMGYDLTTHRAYLNVFGDFYVGDENENTYVKYEQAHNFGTNANPVYNPLLSIKARIEAASTIGNTSIDQYVGTATQTLIDGKNAVYTITGVAMTQSGPDYKAGDIWILPNTIGNYPAGTILVANSDRTIDGVNSHNINKWDKKDSYTDDSAFNGYISRLTAGTLINNPSDAQAITNILNVLKGSLESQTTIDGGLVLTSLIAMRNSDDNVTAGLCGDDQDNEIAAWFGGIQKDYEKLTDAQKSQGWSVQKWAKSLFRFDGSGYLAGGNISWENDGDTTVQGTIKADNFFHAVCHYLEYGLSGIYYGSVLYYYKRESGHDETYDGFVNGKYYTAEQIYSRFRSIPSGFIITTGKADIVMCAPDPNNNWATIDDQLPYVTIPKPEDFQGKVIEVGGFCYSTGASGEPTVKTFEVHCVCGDLNPRDTRMTLLVWLNDNQNGLTTTSLSNKVTISTGGVARFLSVQLADLRWVWVLLANQTGGSVVINGGGGSGTSGVTSVGMTVPAGFSVSPQTITDTGSFDISFARGSLSNGLVLATPSSGNNAPSWRALVASDIPNLDWSKITSGTPTNLSGYGIADAKIENGVITLGGSSIIPLTSQSLNGYATERYVQNNCMMTSERGNYVKIDGDTVTGALTVNDNITIGSGKKLLFGTSAKIYFDDDTIAIDMKDEDNYDVTNYVYHTGNFNPSDYTNVVTAIQVNGQTLAPVSASYPTTFNIDLSGYATTSDLSDYIKGVSVYGSSLNPDTNRVVNIPYADINTPGVIQIGTGLVNDNEGHTTVDTTVIASRQWADGRYLPLTAGSSYPLTGNLYLSEDLVLNNEKLIYFKDHSGTLCDVLSHSYDEVAGIDTLYLGFDFRKNSHSTEIYGNELTLLTGLSARPRLVITFGGNVGIGTNSPAEKLDVAGNVKANGATLTNLLSWNVANADNLVISNNKIQLSVSGTPHNIVLFEGSTASLTSYAKFYERPMVKTGTNNGTPLYTNVALVSEVEAKQNTIHFFNTKNSNTEVFFSNIYLPLNYQLGGTVYLDLSDYVTALGVSGDNLTYTKNGATTNLTVPFATSTMGFKRKTKTENEAWDANTMTVGGVEYALLSDYAHDTWSNMPTGFSWGCVLQLTAATSLSGQLAWDSNHGVTTGVTRKLYWRSRNSTGWGTNDWHTIAFEDWVTTQLNTLGDNLQRYVTTQLGGYMPLAGNSTKSGNLTVTGGVEANNIDLPEGCTIFVDDDECMCFESSGTAFYFNETIYARSFEPTSDINLKNISRYIEPNVREIAAAPIIEFSWKDDARREKQLGSIAQYWEKILPQAVKTTPSGMLSMNYDAIALAAGITAARKAVDNERRIAELEQRVAELESLISG